MAMRFRNPANGYVEEVSSLAPLWVFLFGAIYFAVKGVWTHAIAGVLLAIPTVGLSWLAYPFFTTGIMRKHYLRQGWKELRPGQRPAVDYGYEDEEDRPRVSRGPQDDFKFN